MRKSLNDVKLLLNKYEIFSAKEKGVYIEYLDHDLDKAINVAREIETAKQIIEDNYAKANRKNF